MENNQSPPFHHSYGAPPTHPSSLPPPTDLYYIKQPSQLPPVRLQQPHPSLPLLSDAALLAIPPLASGYAFPLPPIAPSQLAAVLYQHQSLITPSLVPPALPASYRNDPSGKGSIPSPSQSRTETALGGSPISPIETVANSSLPPKPKKTKTPARLAREMARKLKHRERRRIGRRERRNTSRKEGEVEGEEITTFGSDNAYHSDGEIGGSDSGDMDAGSPITTNMDEFGAQHKKHTFGTDGEGSTTPISSTASAVGGTASDGRPFMQFGRSEMDGMNASNSTYQSRTLSEVENVGLPLSGLVTSDLNSGHHSQHDNETQHSSPTGLRFQPPTGPRNPDTYSFGTRDRGSGRRRQDENGFRFETDNRGLRFPQTESGFREKRYRDGNRRPGDRRGFHSDAPHRYNDRDRDHGEYRGPRAPLPAHDRPILHLRRSATPEQFPAMVAAKRQRLDEEGEAEMDIDSPNDSGPTDNDMALPESMPENSLIGASATQIISGENPVTSDVAAPATVPPETADETSTSSKKLDVISMIREAKKSLFGNKKDHSSASGDFISLSGLEDDAGEKGSAAAAQQIPVGLEFSHRDFLHRQNSLARPPTIDTGSAPGTSSVHQPLPPPPGLGQSIQRKRSYSQMSPSPQINIGSPWVRPDAVLDHSVSLYGSVWLHKEIIDFYDYIKPQAYEHAVRHDLVRRLRKIVQSTWPDADIQAFGSFAAEIYLPTSDMDIVVMSRQFFQTSKPKYDTVGNIRKLTRILRDSDVAQSHSVVPIVGAKVPIIKYKDRLTGLSVDISFENASGLIANRTFKQWKEVYPEMPKLALLLKHFLAVRKINEPFNGGLGSFSLICMIVSLLQLMPEASSGNWYEEEHTALGWLLMEFLELYGTKFNYVTTGITVKNPGYFRKSDRKDLFNPSKTGLLVIEDPNNPKNNISKASYKIKEVLRSFSDVYYDINEKLNELHSMPFEQRKGKSVLMPMVGNYDYTPIEEQRKVMQRVFLQNGLGTPEELQRLSGQDLEDAIATYNPGAELSFPPTISFPKSTPTADRRNQAGRGWNLPAPVSEARSKAIKEQKKLRRAEKVKNRMDDTVASAGPDSLPAAGPSADGGKKEKKKRSKGKGKKNID
ncbi:hypothetical protein TWF696_005138 [Orbilia brochopaga]|uniref:polynucleotide adenylyltransferase n=1 Tax=Orbilia brochopaga TaxID=3140254 RepID=A0AAV9V048_9PEZI